ncbi:MAG: triose-phosphate isomerase [Planctomycetota bacterium]|jgi:triosephosphate isomerase
MRTSIVGGNWKMNTDRASGIALADAVVEACGSLAPRCDIVLYPPFPYLEAVGRALEGSGIALGAQDVYHEASGAFTGEVSPGMLRDVGATDVLVGHSERRHVLGEDDAMVRRKLEAALAAGLRVTLCIGETLEQREAGRTEAVNLAQLGSALEGLRADDLGRLTIAYEPVWAIGTGRTATPADAEAVHRVVRADVARLYDGSSAADLRIQYGGSVKAANAAELFAEPDIDGGLIGGASLEAEQFAAIVHAAAATAVSGSVS